MKRVSPELRQRTRSTMTRLLEAFSTAARMTSYNGDLLMDWEQYNSFLSDPRGRWFREMFEPRIANAKDAIRVQGTHCPQILAVYSQASRRVAGHCHPIWVARDGRGRR